MTGLLTPTHVLLLLLVVLLLFGAKRLPEFGRSLGSGLREFKRSVAPGPTPDGTPAGEVTQVDGAGEPAAARGGPAAVQD
jgi:sec-independent protein translocase protein TatA